MKRLFPLPETKHAQLNPSIPSETALAAYRCSPMAQYDLNPKKITAQNYPSIAFVGGGNMTRCIANGLIKNNFPPQSIIVSNRGQEKLELLAKELGVQIAKTNTAAIAAANIVVLAIKPQYVKNVCQEISAIVNGQRPLIISLATATSIASIGSWLANDQLSIVRTMSNTATNIGMGTTALFANAYTNAEQKSVTEAIFAAIGSTFWVNQETDLNTYAPLIGCGPAYLYLLIEAIQNAAIKQGIPEHIAVKMALDVICGASELAKRSNIPVEILRQQVTTPNGVTEASLKPIMAAQYFNLFEQAFVQAKKRCIEIESQQPNAPSAQCPKQPAKL